MAGIGFRLTKYFNHESSFSKIKGSLYAIVLSSGPWLISIVSIATISAAVGKYLNSKDLLIFKSIISYTYAISLLIFGAIELPITRFLADKLYIKDHTTFSKVYLFLLAVNILLSGLIGNIAYYFTDFSLLLIFGCILFLSSTICIWVAMIFLSAARGFNTIVKCFLINSFIGIILSIFLVQSFSLTGVIWGYAIGQLLLATTLSIIILNEFKGEEYFSNEIFDYFKNGKLLVLTGFFYYMGIWIDKILFWYTKEGIQISGPFFTNPYYDTAMFLAYLTIVPASAYFLVKVETDFYTYYKYYYESIENKKSLYFLEEAADMIVLKFREAVLNLLKVQFLVSIICWIFLPDLLSSLNLSALIASPLRYGIIGALCQIVFLIMNIILLYFQDYKSVFKHYFIFLTLNFAMTYLTIYAGYRYHGLGYTIASLVTLLFSYFALNERLKNLNFYTFMTESSSNINKNAIL